MSKEERVKLLNNINNLSIEDLQHLELSDIVKVESVLSKYKHEREL